MRVGATCRARRGTPSDANHFFTLAAIRVACDRRVVTSGVPGESGPLLHASKHLNYRAKIVRRAMPGESGPPPSGRHLTTYALGLYIWRSCDCLQAWPVRSVARGP